MKKRLFAIALSLCMTLSLLPTAAFAAEGGANTGTSSSTSTASTLSDKIKNATDGATVKLDGNVCEDVSIPKDKTVTLNLNNFTLTGKSGAAITVQAGATLIIKGEGTVKPYNNTWDVYSNIVNNGTVIIEGGTFAYEVPKKPDNQTWNVYGNIVNNSGANMTIEGGDFSGEDNTFKNNSGTITITGGAFDAVPGFIAGNYGYLEKGGKFEVLKKATATFSNKSDNNLTWNVYADGKLYTDNNLTWTVYVGATVGEAVQTKFPTYSQTGYVGGDTWKIKGTDTVVNGEFPVTGDMTLVPANVTPVAPTGYNITGDENAVGLPTSAKKGDTVTFTVAAAKEGYSAQVSVVAANNETVKVNLEGNKYSFTMPESNVAVSVKYVANTYSIKAASDSITLKKNSAMTDEEVTFTVEAKNGYTAYVSVDAANNQYVEFKMTTAVNEYLFKMPASDVTVTVNYVKDPTNENVKEDPDFSAGTNETKKPATEGKSQEVVEAMNKANETLGVAQVDKNTLTAAAKQIVANGTVDLDKVTSTNENAQKIADLLKDQPKGTKATIVVQPFLELQVKDAQVKDKNVTAVTINVTPMVAIKATTDPKKMDNNNSVVLDTQKMTVSTKIEMVLPVPANWSKAFVEHKGYVYTGSVNSKAITFQNPHGFSDFTVTSENNTVAKNGETSYTDLGQAIDEAQAKDIITLTDKANGANVNTNRDNKTVTLKKDASVAGDVKVTINNTEYTVTTEGISLTTPRASSGGGGGSASTGYTVTANSSKNGSVSVTPKNASKGDTVTVTVKADKGYELSQLTVTDKDGKTVKLTDKGNGKYTFTMPGSKVEVKAEFVEISTDSANPFRDVSKNAYYYKQVLWAVEKGITSGVSANEFAPEAACTRGQMVTFLWKAAGSPEVSGTLAFNDVSADAYYAKAVRWAAQQGITSGTSAGVFSPNAPCTRGQMAMFLYAYAKNPAVTGSVPFSDVASGDYFNTAVLWAVKNGITSGTSSTTYSPASVCTRGQMVVFLYQLLNK